jgi:hypothetical protein
MNRFPFVYDYTSGRAYYGSTLKSHQNNPEIWTNQQQKPRVSDKDSWKNFAVTAGVVGGIGAAGFLPTKTGNIWDKYLYGIRTAEEFSPGGVLRTLQLSNIFGPFSSKVRNANLFISPELLGNNYTYTNYLSKLIGSSESKFRLFQEGVTFRNGKLFWVTGTEVALPFASALTSAGHGTAQRIGGAYAQNLNLKSGIPLEHFFSNIQPREDLANLINPSIDGEAIQIIGGKNRAQAAYRYAAAIGTEQVSRFNRLLNAQSDLPLLKKPLEKLGQTWQKAFGSKFKLGVEESGGLRMFGKLGLKYGLGLTGLMVGYQTFDWAVRETDALNGTIFDEGLTVAGATAGIKGNLAISRLSEKLGLQDYREKQEEIAPGSTSLTKLAAFPIMGALAPIGGLYGYKVVKMAELARQGLSPAAAREAVTQSIGDWSISPLFKSMKESIDSSKIFSNLGKMTPGKLGALIGATIGAALIAPFLPGALIPSQRPDELEALYSGKKEVPIRKGRWWLMGRSKYEGDAPITYLPHWYPRMRMQATEVGLWGKENVEKMSPLERWWKKETTYELEQRHHYDRPYPKSSQAFEDMPLIGPILSATIGKLIKPSVGMHEENFRRKGGEYLVPAPRYGERYATELGQQPGGVPISPYSPTQVAGRQVYAATEMIGLTGFLASTMKEKITGSQDWFDQSTQLESSRRMLGFERNYWNRELGDLGGLTESWRRLYPHKQNQIDQYNPIPNQYANSWLPGPGEKSINFWTGDPMSQIPFGEYRLPGEGLEQRYPELKGLDVNDYPDIFKYKILADVAPYTDAFKSVQVDIRKARKYKSWTEQNELMYQQTVEQLQERKGGQKFQEYQYLSPTGEIGGKGTPAFMSQVLAEINEQQSAGIKQSALKNTYGGYWELLSHNAETALDQLTPISPGAKLVHQRSAIESYERTRLFGRTESFWQHPVEHFIKPFARSAGNTFGWDEASSDIEKQRDVEEYFDVLKYVKSTRLANIARQAGDTEATQEFETQKNQTLFGINPYTRNYRDLLLALPRKERDYLGAFSEASTVEERSAILKMVPENEKGLYLARWKLTEADQVRKAQKAGMLSQQQLDKADKELENYYQEAKTEGFPTSKELFADYSATRGDGENYADWYRRRYLLPKVKNLPGPDWVGYLPTYDLEDIKLKVVKNEGMDIHNFNLWESREKQLAYKPYMDEETIEPIISPTKISPEEMKARLDEILVVNKAKGQTFIRRDKTSNDDKIEINIEQDRTKEAQQELLKALN